MNPELRKQIDTYIQIAGDDLTAAWTEVNHRIVNMALDAKDTDALKEAVSLGAKSMIPYGISRDKTVAAKSAGVTINAIMPTIILGRTE